MDYIVVSGGRRVEQRWDPSGNGQLVPESKSVGRKLADDAMFKLEHESGDKGKSEQELKPVLEGIFMFSCIWSLGGLCDRQLGKKFSQLFHQV